MVWCGYFKVFKCGLMYLFWIFKSRFVVDILAFFGLEILLGYFLKNWVIFVSNLLVIQDHLCRIFSSKNILPTDILMFVWHREKATWAKCYKTFYGRNLWKFGISKSICPCQAFQPTRMFASKARSFPKKS